MGRDEAVQALGANVRGQYLCLRYAVSPLPPQLAAQLARDEGRHEAPDVGIAIDSQHRIYRNGSVAYHALAGAGRVDGAFRIGPAQWLGLGCVTLLFPPVPSAPHLGVRLCEVRLIIDTAGVRSIAVRG